ncbi:MAG: hypothetical protein ACK4NY_24025 [Spirosomataceae bacterium]
MNTPQSIHNNIKSYLKSKSWQITDTKPRYELFAPPAHLKIDSDYRIYIPINYQSIDFEENAAKIIDIISNIYQESLEDLETIIIENKDILQFHIEGQNIDEKPSIEFFKDLLKNIEKVLYDSAIFTVRKNAHFQESKIEEADRFLNMCKFLKNDKGSLITKIQVPKQELIREENLFDKGIIGREVTDNLMVVSSFINESVIDNQEHTTFDTAFLKLNKEKISVNISEDLKDLYDELRNSDVEILLKGVEGSMKTEVQKLNKSKTESIKTFTKAVREHLNEIINAEFFGRVVELNSKDVEGDTNTIKMEGFLNNVKHLVSIKLSKDKYLQAIDAHKYNKTIYLKGTLEREKTQYKVLNFNEFRILSSKH